MKRGPSTDQHSDDELASALEDEVARITAAIPIVGSAEAPEAEAAAPEPDADAPAELSEAGPRVAVAEPTTMSDAEVTALVDADLSSHDTLAAIEHLQSVLEARAATRDIPIVGRDGGVGEDALASEDASVGDDASVREGISAGQAESSGAGIPAGEDATVGEEDRSAGAPEPRISFDDLPSRRGQSGPRPTFSAWVGASAPPEPAAPEAAGAAAVDGEEEGDETGAEEEAGFEPDALEPHAFQSGVIISGALKSDEVEPEALESEAQEQPDASPNAGPPARAEPLGLVPPELAPRDSQPVPMLLDMPMLSPASEPVPTVTHELGVIGGTPEHIDRDAADDADDVVGSPAPVATPRIPHDEAVLFVPETPASPPALVPERTDLEPTPLDQRAGRAARMFWLWFAGTSSLISVGVGATLFTLGLSLRQLLVATLVGVALSFLPLGIGTLAGKWSGQPTLVISRATFGMIGNALPAALALATKLFWGAVLLWLAGSAAGSLALAEGWSSDTTVPTVIALVVTALAAGVVAFFGYGLVARVQLTLTIASAMLIVAMVAATWRHVDLSRALAVPDALWTHVVTGAILVFSYLGLAWAMSSAEVARYQRPDSSGAAAMLWATFGAAVPPFVLVSYGGLLAASNPDAADELASDPVSGLTRLGLPAWFAVPLLLAVGLSLIAALVLTVYSGGFTLEAIGVRLGRPGSTVVVGAGIALAGGALAATVDDLAAVIRGVPIALSVPVAAWAGIFAGETMLRTRRFHQPSLVRRGGIYPDWRWPNLTMLVVASAVGLGLVSSPLPWLAWEGYLWRLAGVDPHAGFGASTIGVVVALGIGLATPLVCGLPAVRRQERAEA